MQPEYISFLLTDSFSLQYTVVDTVSRGSIEQYRFYRNRGSKIHNIYDAAVVICDKGGKITYKAYYEFGHKHRLCGPAETQYRRSGDIVFQAYYISGKPFDRNLKLPHVIFYNENSKPG